MTLGNKTVRSGADTQVFAESMLRRLQYDSAPMAAVTMAPPTSVPVAPQPAPESMLRKVLKWGYRRVKPLLRPVAWRVRAYINRPLEDRLERIERLLLERQAAPSASTD